MNALAAFLCAVGLGCLTGCGSQQSSKDAVTLLGLNPDGTTNLVAVSDMRELVQEFLACFPDWDKPVTNGVPSELPFPYLYRVEFELTNRHLEVPVYHQDPRIFRGLWRHPSGVHVYFEPEKSRKFMELVNIMSPSANQTVERTGAPPASSGAQSGSGLLALGGRGRLPAPAADWSRESENHPRASDTLSMAQVSDLVEQLVSPMGPPGPEITDYQGGREDMKKWEASLKALFEGYEHPQVASARAKLVSMGTPIFPELIKHLKDKRYSYSFCYAGWVDHSVGDTVGHIIAEVVGGRFHPSGYKWRKNPHGSNGQPSVGQMMSEFGVERYAEHAKGMTKDEAEKEYVEWYMQKEKGYGFVDTQQQEKILAPCIKRLSEL